MKPVVHRFRSSPEAKDALAVLAGGWGGDFWGADEILVALEVPGTVLLFVGEERAWSGCLLGREDGEDAELFYIFVDPSARGRGLGRALFEAWRQGLKSGAIHLEVRPSRHEALELYESLGFQVVRRRKNYYGDGEDALIMKRENA